MKKDPTKGDSALFKDQQSYKKKKKSGKRKLQEYEIKMVVIESVYDSKLLLRASIWRCPASLW